MVFYSLIFPSTSLSQPFSRNSQPQMLHRCCVCPGGCGTARVHSHGVQLTVTFG